jgi:transcriptional regulator with XRE-family HTH domain
MTALDRPGLRAARRARGWSLADAARELERLGRSAGSAGATAASLKSLLSRWENGHATPDATNRGLLARLYQRTPAELGLTAETPQPGGAARLRGRLAAASAVGEVLLHAWEEQLEIARRIDDETGAAGAAGVVRALVEELDRTLVHTSAPGVRARVAVLLARSVTLAGWQDLDLGDAESAWRRFARARETAAIAMAGLAPIEAGGDVSGAPIRPRGAHVARTVGAAASGAAVAVRTAADEVCGEAVAGQAAVLVGLGEPDAALAVLDAVDGTDAVHLIGAFTVLDTRGTAHILDATGTGDSDDPAAPELPPQGAPDALLATGRGALGCVTEGGRAWLAAARGAALAAGGRNAPARQVYDAALRALAAHGSPPEGRAAVGPPEEHADAPDRPDARPRTGVRPTDLRRWRAQALAALGEPDVVSTLEAALAAGIDSARERAATHAALAIALAGRTAATGTAAHPADAHARAARDLAERIGSVRVVALLTHSADRSPESAATTPGHRHV